MLMFRYVLKNLWRHRARTLLTLSGAAVAMFVFCFVGAIQEGLHRLVTGRDADRVLIVFQENRFCPSSSRLPLDYAEQIRKLPEVSEVMPIQVWTNNCRASLDVVVFHGVPPQQLRGMRPLKMSEEEWQAFAGRRDAAIVGRNVAQRRGLKVGGVFSIGEITVTIAGIFASEVPSEENLIYTSLDFLQYTQGADAVGLVTQLEVLLSDNADADSAATAIDAALRLGPVATATRRKGAFQVSTMSDLVDMIRFSHWLGYACVGLVLSLLATTTVMSVQDRIKEYAVLQTIGVRPSGTLKLVLAESTLLCLTGGVTGTLVALGCLAYGGLAIGAEGVSIAFQPSLSLAITGGWVSLVIGVVAGIAPGLQAASIPLVQALQEKA